MTKKIIFGENNSNYESMQNQKDQQTNPNQPKLNISIRFLLIKKSIRFENFQNGPCWFDFAFSCFIINISRTKLTF